MFLSQRSNGVYYLFLTNASGNRRKVSTGSRYKADAIRFMREFKQSAVSPRNNIPLKQFSEIILESISRTHATGTVTMYEGTLNRFAEAIGAHFPIDKITPYHWDVYRNKRLKEGLKPVSVNIETRCLRASMNIAFRWGWIQSNPFSRLPLLKIPESSPMFFTAEDLQSVLSNIKEKYVRELAIFSVLTGMRRGEVCNLKREQVDFANGTVTVETTATFRTKSGRRRVLPVGTEPMKMIQAAIARNESEYVFTLNGKQVDGNILSKRFRSGVRDSQIKNQRLHWHSLRHTAATAMVRSGVSIYVVSKVLGHTSTAVTQMYSAVETDVLRDAIQRINLPTMN